MKTRRPSHRCFECRRRAHYRHPAVPGGTQLVWLCLDCHARASGVEPPSDLAGRRAYSDKHKAERHERRGEVPYGKKVGPDGITLVDEPQEQRAVERIVLLASRGVSVAWIIKFLRCEGYVDRLGKTRWNANTIRRIVARHAREASVNT